MVSFPMQLSNWDCGLACVSMVLTSLAVPHTLVELRNAADDPVRDGVWTIDLAYHLGKHGVEDFTYYTSYIGVNQQYTRTRFYSATLSRDRQRIHALFAGAHERNVRVVAWTLPLDDMIRFLDSARYAILVLVDLKLLTCRECGHGWARRRTRSAPDVTRRGGGGGGRDAQGNGGLTAWDAVGLKVAGCWPWPKRLQRLVVVGDGDGSGGGRGEPRRYAGQSASGGGKADVSAHTPLRPPPRPPPPAPPPPQTSSCLSSLRWCIPPFASAPTVSPTSTTTAASRTLPRRSSAFTSSSLSSSRTLSSPSSQTWRGNDNADDDDDDDPEPVIAGGGFVGHYVLLVGYDARTDRFLYRDPGTAHELCAVDADGLDEARRADGTDCDAIVVRVR
ncbi:hypothetical protein HDU86_005542 [Geranomyces michiganensis]|nr:hypothetical protein HDU86_005542 [Geranomyces michiganensis]